MTDRVFPMIFVVVAAFTTTLVWLFAVLNRLPM
jgi:hypothetical protein